MPFIFSQLAPTTEAVIPTLVTSFGFDNPPVDWTYLYPADFLRKTDIDDEIYMPTEIIEDDFNNTLPIGIPS